MTNSPSDEIVEVVARALCRLFDGRDPDETIAGDCYTFTTEEPDYSLPIPDVIVYGHRWQAYQRKAQAALSALKQAGYAVLPVEPTEAMEEAYTEACDDIDGPAAMHLNLDGYRAMLQAHDQEASQ